MKKIILKTTAYAIVMLSLFIACEKGDVTQEDIINDQQKIDLIINVLNASDGLTAIDSALVSIVTSDGALSIGTDEFGVAVFEDISITSSIPVTVTKSDFTSVHTTVNASPNNYRQAQVSATINLYELSGPNKARVYGRLTIESDVTNRDREPVPAGLIVRAYNYDLENSVAFIGTTDADGNYEINIPVSSFGEDDIELFYPEIMTDQTVAIQDEDDFSIEVVQRPVYYALGTSAESNTIPVVPSVFATVEAPSSATAGSGFAMTSVVVPTPVSVFSNYVIVDGGSGYTDVLDTVMFLSVGVNEDTAQIQVDIVDGAIVNIDGFIDNGALYTSQPTVNTDFAGGSGAEIIIEFMAYYQLVITDNGSGYEGYPDLFIDYSYWDNHNIYTYAEVYNIGGTTDIVNGRIVNDDFSDGDTIDAGPSVNPPVITVVDYPSIPILFEIPHGAIDETTGEITYLTNQDIGYGYDQAAHPTITFTTVAGYGSGAEAIINIDDGSYDDYVITNNGSNYVKNVNDFQDDGSLDEEEQSPIYSTGNFTDFTNLYNIGPGTEYLRSAYYGTGVPQEDE